MNKNYSNFIVFLLIFAFGFFWSVNYTRASILYAGSAQQTVEVGQSFVIDWFLDTQGQSVNALQLDVHYSPQVLEAAEISPGNSVVSLWVKPPSVIAPGELAMQGGIPGGVSGKQLPIFRTVFRAAAPGTAQITLDNSSEILRNDGRGTVEVLNFTALSFPVFPAAAAKLAIVSPSHPDPNHWYQNSHVVMEFAPRPGQEYSYSFSSNLDVIPEPRAQAVPTQIVYDNLPDGIYYFKVNVHTGSSWTEAGMYRVQIDATPPEPFSPLISRDSAMFSGRPFLSFATVDKTSGLAGYRVKVGLFGQFTPAQSPVVLSRPWVGDAVLVQALDHAGNVRSINVPYRGYLSSLEFYAIIFLLICGSAAFLILYWRKAKRP